MLRSVDPRARPRLGKSNTFNGANLNHCRPTAEKRRYHLDMCRACNLIPADIRESHLLSRAE